MAPWDSFAEDHPRAAHAWSRTRRFLPPINFITIHYAYFLVVCLISSVVFWGSSHPDRSVSYTDSLFLVVSAMTEAGLNTVNVSTLTTWQQTILFLLIMLGSTIWVSIWTVLARKHVFQRRFDDIVRAERAKNGDGHGLSVLPKLRQTISFRKAQTVPTPEPSQSMVGMGGESENRRSTRDHDVPLTGAHRRPISRGATSLPEFSAHRPSQLSDDTQLEDDAPGSSTDAAHIMFVDRPHPRQQEDARASAVFADEERPTAQEPVKAENFLQQEAFDIHKFIKNNAPGRHGEFHGLTRHERTQLGGCEYRSLRILAAVVPLYFFLWQLLGCVALGAWMNNHMPDTARENGMNPWWLGVFNGVSAFNNSGMSLLDANMVPFQRAYYVLITMGLMILAGNTAYPLFLRLIIWSWLTLLRKATGKDAFRDTKIALEFILIYPRRVYTNLFPSRPTWWLFFMLICLNGVDWVLFELLNIGNPVTESIPPGPRALVGLFQALAVRSGGFYVVPISQIAIGVQFLYVVMMYISVYPVVITMRHSNLYEERSLGIYSDEGPSDTDAISETDGPVLPQHDPGVEPFSFTTSISDRASNTTRRSALAQRISNSNTAADVGRVLQRSLTFQGVGVPRPRKLSSKHDKVSLSSNRDRPHFSENRIGFVSQQIHGQLAHDIWWLVLAALVITAIETSHFNADPVVFSVFNVIFEVVSAYGTVGISVGLPTAAYSFCGAWHTPSKLVLCLVMLRGRHRGLPVALDHAVRLPGEHLHREEEEDHRIRRSMTERRMSFRS